MFFKRPALAVLAGLCALAVPPARAEPDLRALVSPIHDLTETVNAVVVNTPELVKISKDYARSYQIKSSRISYKAPGHLKIDGNIGPLAVVYVINGNQKAYRYGPLHRTTDVTDAPGKKQGLLDFGILTADQLEDYTWKFVRQESVNGKPLLVYELRYRNFRKDPSRRIIWVDPVHKVVVRRSTYQQKRDNVLKMDMRFEGITRAGNAWVPTVIKVYNPEGKLGAESRAVTVKVNRGLSSSAFTL